MVRLTLLCCTILTMLTVACGPNQKSSSSDQTHPTDSDADDTSTSKMVLTDTTVPVAEQVKIKDIEERVVIYKEYKGPYDKVGPIFTLVMNELQKQEIQPIAGIGIYESSPETPDAEKQSKIGFIIEQEPDEEIPMLKVMTLEAGKAAYCNYDNLDQIQATYKRISDYIEKNELMPVFPPIEIYPENQKSEGVNAEVQFIVVDKNAQIEEDTAKETTDSTDGA